MFGTSNFIFVMGHPQMTFSRNQNFVPLSPFPLRTYFVIFWLAPTPLLPKMTTFFLEFGKYLVCFFSFSGAVRKENKTSLYAIKITPLLFLPKIVNSANVSPTRFKVSQTVNTILMKLKHP